MVFGPIAGYLTPCNVCYPCEQCVYTDHFDNGSISDYWKEHGTPAFLIDAVNEQVIASGDGSLTILIVKPEEHENLWVEAEIADSDSGATATGITIGHAAQDARISFVRVWGTANGYELRQGTDVLEAFTSTETGALKLVIESPHESTTDIKCYIGGTWVHTESAVAWDLLDISPLYAGAIAEDGGKWQYITVSPCPAPLCGQVSLQCGVFSRFPLTFTLDATSIGGSVITGTCDDRNWCEAFADHYTFLIADRVAAYQTGGFSCTHPTVAGWVGVIDATPGPLTCAWFPVFANIDRKVEGFPNNDGPGMTDRWALRRLWGWGTVEPEPCEYYTPICSNHCGGQGYCATLSGYGHPLLRLEKRELTPGVVEVRLNLVFTSPTIGFDPPPLHGDYYSDWVADDHDYAAADTVVTLDGTTATGCDWPGTLTLVPDGNLEFARRVNDCDPCSECEAQTQLRGWEVEIPWTATEYNLFQATRLYKCLTASCVNPGDAFTPGPTGFFLQFRPETDCGWILCGSAIRVCDTDNIDAFGQVKTNCLEYNPPGEERCCFAYNRAYATLGYNHQEGEIGTSLQLIIWTPNWDRFDGVIASGPWVVPLVKYESTDSICAERVTFTKIFDDTDGTYFPEEITASRIEMHTDCDGPTYPEPEPLPEEEWCPGDPNPTEELCGDVQISGSPTVDYAGAGETDPPTLQYDSGNSWSSLDFGLLSDCDPVIFVWSFSCTLVCSDVNDPFATWQLHVTGAYNTGGPSTPFDYLLDPVGPVTCPPLSMEFDLTGPAATGSATEPPPFVDCNAVSFDATVSIFPCPAPAMPAMAESIQSIKPLPKIAPVQRKTPEDVPCVHRGGYLQTLGCCGDIYQCKNKEVFARTNARACTINANNVGYQSCVNCPNRLPPDETVP